MTTVPLYERVKLLVPLIRQHMKLVYESKLSVNEHQYVLNGEVRGYITIWVKGGGGMLSADGDSMRFLSGFVGASPRLQKSVNDLFVILFGNLPKWNEDFTEACDPALFERLYGVCSGATRAPPAPWS